MTRAMTFRHSSKPLASSGWKSTSEPSRKMTLKV